ncbi:MAG: AAA family ATPase [Clostridiales bacterium]|jgi:chromosome partitioning protein|nr:AAA family ATPase [Clostridiales bacterium]
MGNTIVIGARKGGVGKATTAVSLGVGLVREGKKTLVIDADSQRSLTASLGVMEPDKLKATLSSVMISLINGEDVNPAAGIIHHKEGVDLLPASNRLAGVELALTPVACGRELVLRGYIYSRILATWLFCRAYIACCLIMVVILPKNRCPLIDHITHCC